MSLNWMLMAAAPKGDLDERGDVYKHLELLFLFAQTLTLDTDRAAWLVEETYRKATEDNYPNHIWREKRQLLRLMVQIHKEEGEETVHGFLPDRIRRIAEKVLDLKLPVALASLPTSLRAIITLTELEGLSSVDAGYVLQIDHEQAQQYLKEARVELTRTLDEAMTPAERKLIKASLEGDWIRSAMHRLAEGEFETLPPTLRVNVVSAVRAVDRDDEEDFQRAEYKRPERVSRTSVERNRLRHILVGFSIIIVAGLVGFLLSDTTEEVAVRDLIAISTDQAREITPAFRTSNQEQAERYVQDRLNRHLAVPEIDQASLIGVSIEQIARSAEVPVFLFQDQATGETITLFAYSYAFLDRFNDRLELEPDILRQIQDDQHFDLHDLGEAQVLVWRNRDEIYVAVVRVGAETLRDRISFPS